MSEELKQYRLVGLNFVHDSRGKFVQKGDIAWLDDMKAGKILRALSNSGREDDLVLIDETPEIQSEPELTDPPTSDSTASESGGEGALLSVDILDTVLALHFSKRKEIAVLISGEEIESTPQADSIIEGAQTEDLIAAFEAVTSEE